MDAEAKPDDLTRYSEARGAVPKMGPIGESFWAGYQGIGGPRRGVAGSVQRRAYEAGVSRAKVEPGLKPLNRGKQVTREEALTKLNAAWNQPHTKAQHMGLYDAIAACKRGDDLDKKPIVTALDEIERGEIGKPY